MQRLQVETKYVGEICNLYAKWAMLENYKKFIISTLDEIRFLTRCLDVIILRKGHLSPAKN